MTQLEYPLAMPRCPICSWVATDEPCTTAEAANIALLANICHQLAHLLMQAQR